MYRKMLKSKIHQAKVTHANLNYEGSITIDENLMEIAGLLPNEKVHVLNITNGQRAETYVIKGKRNSGEIMMNGAIARIAQVGDLVIILSYCIIEEEKIKDINPVVVICDDNNHVLKIHS